MTYWTSNAEKNTTRRLLTAAGIAAVGLVLTTGVHAARADEVAPPAVPDLLKVEDGNVVFRVGHAFGTQNYVCAPSATSVTGFAYALFTPQATLLDGMGDQLTTHFFSP